MKNKSLILKPDTHVSLRNVSSLLTITDKILQKSNNRLFEILMNNPKAAVVLLSRFYPFDGGLIER
jgi:predicted nucleotide-binding protein (sugar kinase/HSP70/actin superfamily)